MNLNNLKSELRRANRVRRNLRAELEVIEGKILTVVFHHIDVVRRGEHVKHAANGRCALCAEFEPWEKTRRRLSNAISRVSYSIGRIEENIRTSRAQQHNVSIKKRSFDRAFVDGVAHADESAPNDESMHAHKRSREE